MDNIASIAKVVVALPAIATIALLMAGAAFTIAKYGLLRRGRDEERD